MYAAQFGDGTDIYVAEAIRLTWNRQPLDPASRAYLDLRLSRFLESPVLGFAFDMRVVKGDAVATIITTRRQSETEAMPVSAAQLLLLDRLPMISAETPADRTAFDAWAANDLVSGARLAIKTFTARRNRDQEAVLPWLTALSAAVRNAIKADLPIRLILCVRPHRADSALITEASALATDVELPQQLPPKLIQVLRARVSVVPRLEFLVEATLLTASVHEMADLDRLYRSALEGQIGISNASALELTTAPETIVTNLTIHPTYLSSSRPPHAEMLSRGFTHGELVDGIIETFAGPELARIPDTARVLPKPRSEGTAEMVLRPRSDATYYGLRVPPKTRADFIFVSYRQTHIPQLIDVLDHLSAIGAAYWYDRGIELGQEWDAQIEDQISRCRAFLAILSESYFDSKICRREFKFADCLNKKIVAIAFEPLKPTDGLAMAVASLQVGFLGDPGIRDFITRALRA